MAVVLELASGQSRDNPYVRYNPISHHAIAGISTGLDAYRRVIHTKLVGPPEGDMGIGFDLEVDALGVLSRSMSILPDSAWRARALI